MIDMDKLKGSLLNTITTADLNESIVAFQDNHLGIVDGQLSQACATAIVELMPKTTFSIPMSTMESNTMSFGKYKRISCYAREQWNNSQQAMGVLYIYPDKKSDAFTGWTALGETIDLLDDPQRNRTAVYCHPTIDRSTRTNVSELCSEKGIYYTEDFESAYQKWSTGHVGKSK